MSHRRKRKLQQPKSQKSRAFWKVILVVAALVVGTIGVLYKLAIDYLHSMKFRDALAEKVSVAIGAPSNIGEMRWSMLHLKNDDFYAASEGALESVSASGVELNIGDDFLISDSWKVSGVVVRSAKLELDLTKQFSVIESKKKSLSWIEKQLPENAELKDLKVLKADAFIHSEYGDLIVDGLTLDVLQEDYGYSATLSKGDVALPLPILKTAHLEQMDLRILNQRLVVDFAELAVFDSGRLELDGELDYSGSELDYGVNGWLTGLHCSDIVNADWKQRLTGKVESKFSAQPNSQGEIKVSGKVSIRDGELTALPVLDTIAAYTAVREFKRLRFSEFYCDFVRIGSLLKLKNIYLHCDGLLRIEGYLDWNDGKLDGLFQVGLNPGTLGHIPGAEDKVFRPGKEGMSWASVRIGGTNDDVTEDLSDRMIASAGERLFEMVGGDLMMKFGGAATENLEALRPNDVGSTLKETAGSFLETSKGVLDTGTIIKDPIQSGSDLIHSGLSGLLGGDQKNEEEQEE